AGVPLLSGFISKELIFTSLVEAGSLMGGLAWLLPGVATVASLLTALYSFVLFHEVFDGQARGTTPRPAREASPVLLLSPGLLTAVAVLVGLGPLLGKAPPFDPPPSALAGNLMQINAAPGQGLNGPFPIGPTPRGGARRFN